VIGAITGEWFAGSTQVGHGGLGYSILYAMSQLQTDYLFALVIAATALGFVFFFLVMFFEWLALHKWHESATRRERGRIGAAMLRLETEDGWWLVTHPDHAHLAGEFASHWGNAIVFVSPEPREHVLRGIYAHDDGWASAMRSPW
jgi:hypothetical protein